MRKTRTSGSGRGDQGNLVPYRHRIVPGEGCPAKVGLPKRLRSLSFGGGIWP